MVWTDGLKAEMKRNNLTQEDVAKALGISSTSINMKLLNRVEFKASEVFKLASLLNIRGQYDDYFFREELE